VPEEVGITEERTGEIEYDALEFENDVVEVKPPEPPPPPAPKPPKFDFDERLETNPGRRRSTQWFEDTFDEDYVRTLPRLTEEQTKREANFIQQTVGTVAGAAALLDVGCGTGRHALELAGRGHQVTALDLSLPLLIKAAEQARRQSATVNFVHGDMRALTFENEYDAAYCMASTFGYFDDDTNKMVLQNIARALKPNGRLLLDLCNRDYLVPNLPTRVWWEGEGCVVLEEVEFNFATSRLQVQRSIVFDDGRQKDQDISIRAYSLHEIGRLLHACGLRTVEVSGGMPLRGKFFGSDSRQLLVVAEKR
jgi:SAM-dependent methyltransferase